VRDRAGNRDRRRRERAGAAGADLPQDGRHGCHHGARQRQHGGDRRFAGRGRRGPANLAAPAPAEDAAQEGERGRGTGEAPGGGTGELGPQLPPPFPHPPLHLTGTKRGGK